MTTDDMISFLRASREEAGLTIREVAAKLGTKDDTLASWEKGRIDPPSRKLGQWARLFGCELLLRDTGLAPILGPLEERRRTLFGSPLPAHPPSMSAVELLLGPSR